MYGQEYAYVPQHQNGTPLDTYLRLKDRKVQEQRYQQELEKQQRRYQDELLTQAMSQLDFKHFATGTQLDPVIHNSLSNALKGISKKIMENPDVNSASVYYDVANAVNDIAGYSTKAKNIRANIEAASKEYAKNPSINAPRLLQAALTNAFTKYDPNTHSYSVKDPSEIDDAQDWVQNTMLSNPEQVAQGSGALDLLLKNSDKKAYENEYSVDKGGVKRKIAFKGEYFPYNTIETDKEGRPIFDPMAGRAKVGVRSESVGGVPVATADDLKYFTSDPGANVFLNAQVKQLGVDPNSEQGVLIKRKLLYDHLQKNNQGYINKVKDEQDDSQLQSQMWREEMKTIARSNKSTSSGGGSTELTFDDIFSDIDEWGKKQKEAGKYAIQFNMLSPSSQSVLSAIAAKSPAIDQEGKKKDDGFNTLWVRINTDGSYSLMRSRKTGVIDYKDVQITPLNAKAVNTLGARTQGERNAVRGGSNQTKPTTQTAPKKKVYNPKTGKFE
jgi:hypothetical protein